MKKFEVRERVNDNNEVCFGIWNNNMIAWQYIHEWEGISTKDKSEADAICESTNYFHDLIS